MSVGRELKMGDARDREPTLMHGRTRADGWVPVMVSPDGTSSTSGSASSLFSSTSSLTDDDVVDEVTSSPSGHGQRPVPSSSSSSLTSSESSDKMRTDGGAADEGPLFELATMLDHLPELRTGLSKFYRGRSQSFTSLAEVTCAEDLAKKTTPYIRGTKPPRCYATALSAKNQLSKKIAKKVQSSPDRLLSRARIRSTSLLHSSARPPAYHVNREVYRC